MFADPRTWIDEGPKLIWLDPRDNLFAIVDPIDHLWAVKYTWSPIRDKHGKKVYAVRWTTIEGKTVKLFLHKEIVMKRRRPSIFHTIGDHRNGNSLDCRRKNLKWATPSQNRRNIRREDAEAATLA